MANSDYTSTTARVGEAIAVIMQKAINTIRPERLAIFFIAACIFAGCKPTTPAVEVELDQWLIGGRIFTVGDSKDDVEKAIGKKLRPVTAKDIGFSSSAADELINNIDGISFWTATGVKQVFTFSEIKTEGVYVGEVDSIRFELSVVSNRKLEQYKPHKQY